MTVLRLEGNYLVLSETHEMTLVCIAIAHVIDYEGIKTGGKIGYDYKVP